MGERWGDSQRDRDQLDRWITREPPEPDDDARFVEVLDQVGLVMPVADEWDDDEPDAPTTITDGVPCPYCRLIMSCRENAEQGACNDCYGGAYGD